jgi:hypothetical protein
MDASVPGFCAIARLEGKQFGIHILNIRGQKHASSRVDYADGTRQPVGHCHDKAQFSAKDFSCVDTWDTIWAPPTPKHDPAPIGFAIQPDAAFILYSGGTLRVFWPQGRRIEGHQDATLNRWRADGSAHKVGDKSPAPDKDDHAVDENPAKRRKCMVRLAVKFDITLLAAVKGTTGNNSGEKASEFASAADRPPCGGLASVGGGYVMVGYGRVVSVWDGLYGVGHGYVELPCDLVSISKGAADGEAIVFLSNGSIFSVAMDLSEEFEGLSLGIALKRQHSCLSITSFQSNTVLPSKAPLHVQPVASSILKATADAGGSAPHLFENFVKTENRDEMRRVRKVLDPTATPTAKDVGDSMLKFVFGNKATRRVWKWAERSPSLKEQIASRPRHRLELLPSERLAASVVARCLRELHRDGLTFLVPLIDMLGSGVVSADFVLAVISDLNAASVGAESDEHVPVSLTAPLVRQVDTSSALEAMLLRVADIAELDVIRMVQFGLRIVEAHRSGKSEGKGELAYRAHEQEDALRTIPRRAERLLGRCITRPVDEKQVTSALQRMPLQDVVAFLRYLKRLLNDDALAEKVCFPGSWAENLERRADETDCDSPSEYRGAGLWLDEPAFKDVSTVKALSLLQQRCVDWIGRLSDVHMTTLVMDERGAKVLTGLLEVVRAQKARTQSATPLIGILQHVREKFPVPTKEDPLYSVDCIHISSFAALT